MTLDIALDADEEWDSSSSWLDLARKAVAAAVAESAFPALATARRTAEVSVTLTGDERVRELNGEWRGKDRPTDVLSFPLADPAELEAAAEEPELLLGDIVLARGVCVSEAAEKGISIEDHAVHLMVHGTLHLLGHDHQDEAEAQDMEMREIRALARLGIADPYRAAA